MSQIFDDVIRLIMILLFQQNSGRVPREHPDGDVSFSSRWMMIRQNRPGTIMDSKCHPQFKTRGTRSHQLSQQPLTVASDIIESTQSNGESRVKSNPHLLESTTTDTEQQANEDSSINSLFLGGQDILRRSHAPRIRIVDSNLPARLASDADNLTSGRNCHLSLL
jgi:hypothetical protein